MTRDEQRSSGLYHRWSAKYGEHLVHPDDLERFTAFGPGWRVFNVHPSTDGMIELRYGSDAFRVNPERLTAVPPTKFRVGDTVEVVGKDGVATIREIIWYFKNECPYYLVDLNGKKKSKHYWQDDLRPIAR